MKTLPISEIIVPPNRQRREFDPMAIAELRTSITETPYGLQHPVVIRRGERGTFLLVAGERRLRAAQEALELNQPIKHAGETLPLGEVPVVDLGDLDPTDAFEAELEENLRRTDLTMLEQAQATAKLLELRTLQARKAGSPPPTTADLAREKFDLPGATSQDLGERQTTVRNQLIVARHAADPEVRKATSLKEAVKIIKKKEEAKLNVELAATHGALFKSASHQLHHGDCLDLLPTFESGSFNLIISDPPYGIGADGFTAADHKGETHDPHPYDDSLEAWQRLMDRLPQELFRLAAADAHAYLFCDIDRFLDLRSRMTAAGWTVHRTPLIWHNPDGYRAPWPEHGPQRKYELILFAKKGDRKVNKVMSDVIECRKDSALGHPAQKPVALLENLLQRSARPGDRVLDPVVGTGSTIVACDKAKLSCVGVEKDAGSYGIALKRLQGLKEIAKELF